MRINPVKKALREGSPQVGTWLSLGSPMAARFLAKSGFHWLTVDLEHTPLDWETAAVMFATIADAGGVPLARVPANSIENAKRALDAGAFGIIFPMCCCVEEAEQAVAACKYPPAGRRSVGGGLHALNFGASPSEYYRRANDEILIIIQAEHVDAVENCDKIFAVPGLDGMFVGPNDLLSSMNKPPAMDSEDREFRDALRHLRETAVRHGIAPGIHNLDAPMARRRMDEGWQFVAVSSELAMMTGAARAAATTLIGESGGEGPRY